MRPTTLERFKAKYSVNRNTGCWEWKASVTLKGYGNFWDGEKLRPAHRWAYEHFVGPIPEGLQLDHLCRVRCCVRPSHLEPVTNAQNAGRGAWATRTHCLNGHPFSSENTYMRPSGGRRCRTCMREYLREYQQKRKAS